MKYSVSAKNSKSVFKQLNSGKNGIEVYFIAERQNLEEHLDKKIYLKYSINKKGQQVLEIFGSEEVIIVADKFKTIELND